MCVAGNDELTGFLQQFCFRLKVIHNFQTHTAVYTYLCNCFSFALFFFCVFAILEVYCLLYVFCVIRWCQPSEYDDRLLRVDPAKSRDDSAPAPLIGTIIPARYSASISSICWLNVSSRRYKNSERKIEKKETKKIKLNFFQNFERYLNFF